MFFVIIGVAIAVPVIGRVANRVVEEIFIPRRDLKKLQQRRTLQESVGIPEEKREVTLHYSADLELTEEEFTKLRNSGALEIIARAANRRPHIKRAEEKANDS